MSIPKHFVFILLWMYLNSNTAEFGWSCLYQPHRAAYDKKVFFDKECDTKQQNECVFCRDANMHDDANTFIIKRFKYNFVALNLFPYQKGHLLALPFDHVDSLDQMPPEARAELMEIITLSVQILKEVLKADGANVGINLGRIAGASKPDHLHIQIVPRWQSDTSWIHIIGKTSLLAQDLHLTYNLLKERFDQQTL